MKKAKKNQLQDFSLPVLTPPLRLSFNHGTIFESRKLDDNWRLIGIGCFKETVDLLKLTVGVLVSGCNHQKTKSIQITHKLMGYFVLK